MAQVRRDRSQQIELALGKHEILPGIRRIEMGRELAQARRRRVPGAQVQIGGQRRRVAPRPGGEQADLGGGADLLDREPELGRHLFGVAHAGEAAPRPSALGERGVGHLHDERRAVRQGRRLSARAADEHEPFRAVVDGAQQGRALDGRQVPQAVDAQPAAGEHRGQPGVGHRLRLLEVPGREDQHRRVDRRGHHRSGIRAAHDERQPGVGGQQRGDLGHRLLAPDRGIRVDAPQPRPGDRAAQIARSQQEGGEAIGHLDRPVGQRRCRVGGDEADRAAAGQTGAGLEARQHVGRVHALPAQQVGRQPWAGQAAGDVVLEVGVETAVARLQLRCRAQGEHGAVKRVEAEPRHRLLETRSG